MGDEPLVSKGDLLYLWSEKRVYKTPEDEVKKREQLTLLLVSCLHRVLLPFAVAYRTPVVAVAAVAIRRIYRSSSFFLLIFSALSPFSYAPLSFLSCVSTRKALQNNRYKLQTSGRAVVVKKPGQLFTYQKEVRLRKQFEMRDQAINSGKNAAAFAGAEDTSSEAAAAGGAGAEGNSATDAATGR